MDQKQVSTTRKVTAALAVCMVIAIIVIASANAQKRNADVASASVVVQTAQAASTTQSMPASTSGMMASMTAPGYRDGTYVTTVVYDSPAGGQAITIHVTLKGGVVSATSAQAGATDGDSREYQDSFIAGYKQLVVGRRITDIHLSRVSGASLTSQGFNNAIQKIESEARA